MMKYSNSLAKHRIKNNAWCIDMKNPLSSSKFIKQQSRLDMTGIYEGWGHVGTFSRGLKCYHF